MVEADIATASAENETLNAFADVNASGGNTRSLEFQSKDLGQDIDLLLMFQTPDKPGTLWKDMFPVCWRVISIAATGLTTSTVVYTSQTALYVPQVDVSNLVSASNGQPCETGQRCTLKMNDKGNNYLTPAVLGTDGLIKCENATGRPGDIGIGFINSKGTKVEPALIWQNVANKSTLAVELTPKLMIYAVSDYQETEIIRGEIESPCLWTGNLIGLKASTIFNVSITEGTGEIVVKPE